MATDPAGVVLARDDAGQPWRTGYYVASRDWPVPPDGGPTLAEAYAAAETMRTQEVPNGA